MKTAFLQENHSNIKHHKKKKSNSSQGKPSKISKLKNDSLGKKINIINTEYDTHLNGNIDIANTVDRNLFFNDVYVGNENSKELKSNLHINYDRNEHINIDNYENIKKINLEIKVENNLKDFSSFNLEKKHCKSEPLLSEMCKDSFMNIEWNKDLTEDFEFVIVDNIDLFHQETSDDVHEAKNKDITRIISVNDCLVALKHDDRRNVIKDKKRSHVVEKTAKLTKEVKSNNQTDLSDLMESSQSNIIESHKNSTKKRKKSIIKEGLFENMEEDNETYLIDDCENDQCNLMKTPENNKSTKKKDRKKALTQLEENNENHLMIIRKKDQFNPIKTPDINKSSRKKVFKKLEGENEKDMSDSCKNDNLNLIETLDNNKYIQKKDRKKSFSQFEGNKEKDLIDISRSDQFNLMETPEKNISTIKKERKKSLRKLEENCEKYFSDISRDDQCILMKTPEKENSSKKKYIKKALVQFEGNKEKNFIDVNKNNLLILMETPANNKSIKKKHKEKVLTQLETDDKELSKISKKVQYNLIETPGNNKKIKKKNRTKALIQLEESGEKELIKISRIDRFHQMETPANDKDMRDSSKNHQFSLKETLESDESTKKVVLGHFEEMMNNLEESNENNVSDIDRNDQFNLVPSEKSNNSKKDLNEVVIENNNMNDIDDQRDISDVSFIYNQSQKRDEEINVDVAELNCDNISIIEDNAHGWQQVLSSVTDIDDEGELTNIIGRYKEFSMTQSKSNSISVLNIEEISDNSALKSTNEIVDNEDLSKEVIFESTLGNENDNRRDIDGIGSKEPSADVMDVNCTFIIVEPEEATEQDISEVDNNGEVRDHIEDDASLFSDCSSHHSMEIETQNTEYKNNNDDDVISLICNQELEKEIMNKKKLDIIQAERFDRSDKEVFSDSTKEVEATITQTENIDNILQFNINSSFIEETANKELSLLDNFGPKETVLKSSEMESSIIDNNQLETSNISSDAVISNFEIISLSPSILREELETDTNKNHNVNLDEEIRIVLDDIMSSALFCQVNSKSKKVADSICKTSIVSSVRKRRLSPSTMEPSNKISKLNNQVNQSLNKSVSKALIEDTPNLDLFNEMKMNFEKGILLSDGLVICPASLLNGNFSSFDASDLTCILRVYDKEITEKLTNRVDIINRCLLKLSQSNVIRAAYFSELQKCVFLKYDSLPEDTLKKYGISRYKYDKALWNYSIKQKICRDLISIKTPTTLEELLQTELEYLSLMSDS